MSDDVLIISVVIAIGMLEIIMGLPLVLEKIKPNRLYGFRLKATLSNEEIWYKSNKRVGRDFIIMGTLVVLCSLFVFGFRSEFSYIELVWITIILTIAPVIVLIISAFSYLKKLEKAS